MGGGEEGIGNQSNNLVYKKRQKGMYANRKHETTAKELNNIMGSILVGLMAVVYFDQLSGAAQTKNWWNNIFSGNLHKNVPWCSSDQSND